MRVFTRVAEPPSVTRLLEISEVMENDLPTEKRERDNVRGLLQVHEHIRSVVAEMLRSGSRGGCLNAPPIFY